MIRCMLNVLDQAASTCESELVIELAATTILGADQADVLVDSAGRLLAPQFDRSTGQISDYTCPPALPVCSDRLQTEDLSGQVVPADPPVRTGTFRDVLYFVVDLIRFFDLLTREPAIEN